MADLENLLLEAAGRTNSAQRNRYSLPPSKRRHDGSDSDGGSDSNGDDHNYASKKPYGTPVPVKKRVEQPNDRDDDKGSNDESDGDGSDREGDSSDESDVGRDLYKNEDC